MEPTCVELDRRFGIAGLARVGLGEMRHGQRGEPEGAHRADRRNGRVGRAVAAMNANAVRMLAGLSDLLRYVLEDTRDGTTWKLQS